MKHNGKTSSRFKHLIYSSAILAALSPAIKTEAQETDSVNSNLLLEDSALSSHQTVLKEIVLKSEQIILDEKVSLMEIMDIVVELHENENFETARSLYSVLTTYKEFDESVIDQIHTNEIQAESQTSPTPWSLTDEQRISYESIIVIDEDKMTDFLDQKKELTDEELTFTEDEQNTAEESIEEEKKAETLEIEEAVEIESAKEETVEVEENTEEVSAFATTSSLSEADTIYRDSVHAQYVTVAWNKAVEGYTKFPNDDRFEFAIEKAAKSSMNYADSLASRGKATSALSYYNRTLSSPWLSTELKERAESSKAEMYAAIEEAKREALYRESVHAKYATVAWNKAVEGYNTYPDDSRFQHAIEKAATNSLNYADSLKAQGKASSAMSYYDRTLSSPWLSEALRERATTSKASLIDAVEEEKREALYRESVHAKYATVAWNKAVEGYNTYPDDSRFQHAIEKAATSSMNYADSLRDKGKASSAMSYYDRTLSSPWLSEALRERATTSKAALIDAVEEEKRETLYRESVHAKYATVAWNKAVEGYNTYPDDSRFQDAIEKAATNSLNYADSLRDNGKASSAISYYDRILNSPWLSEALRERATTSKISSIDAIEEEKRETLYRESVHAKYATVAWNKAVEGYNTYPDDGRFQDAIEKAAINTLNYADSLESKGKAADSISYYDRILNSPWMTKELYNRALGSKEEMLKFLDSDYAYQEIINETDKLIAWNIATEAIVNHPEDTRIEKFIAEQAEILREEAITLHKDYQYGKAIERYNLLISGPTALYSGESIAEKYKILAANELIPNHASYENSYYLTTLETALDEQMKRAPQTYGDKSWINASKEQVSYYLNPENFLGSIEKETKAYSIKGKVNTSALNVRDGQSTNYTRIDQIYIDQDVSVLNEINGWLHIAYTVSGETKTGWVSGTFIDLADEEERNHDFNEAYNPVGRITASVLNVRRGPGTDHVTFTSVNKGQRYKIIKASNNWYQIELSDGQTGWVSGDYVAVANTLEKDLLQFVKLSGSSGISEAKLNEELGKSGVLSGMGSVFLEASQRYNINEIYLLGHAKLETGNGSSSLATGITVTEVDGQPVEPKKVYNMFGIAAFDSSPLKSGSEYAYKMGWDTVEKSIMGGAEWISNQYVNHTTHEQDTLYKMRWNPLNPGAHQYATDIGWAYKQTHTLNTLVEVSQKYNLHLNFDVPVYNQQRLQ